MKKQQLIALQGRGSCGKTTAIGLMHQLLVQRGDPISHSSFSETGKDFRTVVTINGQLIGITSKGDAYDYVKDDLDWLIDKRCEHLICACRTSDRRNNRGERRGSNAAVDSFTDYEITRLNKTVTNVAAREDEVNRQDAQRLLDELLRRI